MSPEQASGDRTLDSRTDIYALGSVLYEMLAGEPPFTGLTPQAIVIRKSTESPSPLRAVRETVPQAIEEVVGRTLARWPADRMATAGELAATLERALRAGGPRLSSGAAPRFAPPPASPPKPRLGGRAWRYAVTLTLIGGFAIGLGVLFAWRSTHARLMQALSDARPLDQNT